jgi:hypothetical protein
MILLPGSLPNDGPTLAALCEKLPTHSEIAKWFQACEAEPFDGSWGDAERLSDSLPARRGGLGWGKDLGAATVSANQSNALPPPNLPAGGEAESARGVFTQRSAALASPLHAALGLSDLTPLDPSKLQLTNDESRALCESADVLMREEGVRIEFLEATQWRVTANREIDVLTERPDWIIGEPLRPNLPRGRDARLVERWMNELQMLFFSHPVNEARAARGLPVVNMIWLWGFSPLLSEAFDVARGSGARPGTSDVQPGRAIASPGYVAAYDTRMLTALRSGDLPRWQRAWGELSERITTSNALIIGDSRPRFILRKPTHSPSITKKLSSLFARQATLAAALQSLQQQL